MDTKRVLVVDDNEANRALCRDILTYLKIETLIAFDGPGAIKAVRESRPDLVLMDINLPGIDGLETARQIHRIPESCHIPIIALSGQSSEEWAAPALDAGCREYISKPIDVEQFMGVVKKHLGL